MFLNQIIKIGSNTYSFVSGVLISVSMEAVVMLKFSVEPVINNKNIWISAAISFSAGIFWYWLGLETNKIKAYLYRQASLNDQSLEDEYNTIPHKTRHKAIVLFIFAISISLAWIFL